MSTCLTLEHNGTDIVTPLLLHLQLMPENENEDYSEDENEDESQNEIENEIGVEKEYFSEEENEEDGMFRERHCRGIKLENVELDCGILLLFSTHLNGNKCFVLMSETYLDAKMLLWKITPSNLNNKLLKSASDEMKSKPQKINGSSTARLKWQGEINLHSKWQVDLPFHKKRLGRNCWCSSRDSSILLIHVVDESLNCPENESDKHLLIHLR